MAVADVCVSTDSTIRGHKRIASGAQNGTERRAVAMLHATCRWGQWCDGCVKLAVVA